MKRFTSYMLLGSVTVAALMLADNTIRAYLTPGEVFGTQIFTEDQGDPDPVVDTTVPDNTGTQTTTTTNTTPSSTTTPTSNTTSTTTTVYPDEEAIFDAWAEYEDEEPLPIPVLPQPSSFDEPTEEEVDTEPVDVVPTTHPAARPSSTVECGDGVIEGSEECEYSNDCNEDEFCTGCRCVYIGDDTDLETTIPATTTLPTTTSPTPAAQTTTTQESYPTSTTKLVPVFYRNGEAVEVVIPETEVIIDTGELPVFPEETEVIDPLDLELKEAEEPTAGEEVVPENEEQVHAAATESDGVSSTLMIFGLIFLAIIGGGAAFFVLKKGKGKENKQVAKSAEEEGIREVAQYNPQNTSGRLEHALTSLETEGVPQEAAVEVVIPHEDTPPEQPEPPVQETPAHEPQPDPEPEPQVTPPVTSEIKPEPPQEPTPTPVQEESAPEAPPPVQPEEQPKTPPTEV